MRVWPSRNPSIPSTSSGSWIALPKVGLRLQGIGGLAQDPDHAVAVFTEIEREIHDREGVVARLVGQRGHRAVREDVDGAFDVAQDESSAG